MLPNKSLALLGTFTFLGLWHGYYPGDLPSTGPAFLPTGYLIAFTLEFFSHTSEESVRARIPAPTGLLFYPAAVLGWALRIMVRSSSSSCSRCRVCMFAQSIAWPL